jgi:hypothetical protein
MNAVYLNCTDTIKLALRNFFPGVTFERRGFFLYAELQGGLPQKLVLCLRSLAADVAVYRHHGTTASVVCFLDQCFAKEQEDNYARSLCCVSSHQS